MLRSFKALFSTNNAVKTNDKKEQINPKQKALEYKPSKFEQVPFRVLRTNLFPHQTPNEAAKLAQASHATHVTYTHSNNDKDNKGPLEVAHLTYQFVDMLAKGQRKAAAAFLLANKSYIPQILSQKAIITDHSQRKFFAGVTALQYVFWALDWHGWNVIKDHIPFVEAKKQLEEMERAGGVAYEQAALLKDEKPEVRREMHYNFAFLKPLQNYINVGNAYFANTKTDDDVVAACSALGRKQCEVPAHVAQEYCHPKRNFGAVPKFAEEDKLPESFKVIKPKSEWFLLLMRGERLDNFAIFRGDWDSAAGPVPGGIGQRCGKDFSALTALRDVRTLQFKQLKSFYLTPALLTDEDSPTKEIKGSTAILSVKALGR